LPARAWGLLQRLIILSVSVQASPLSLAPTRNSSGHASRNYLAAVERLDQLAQQRFGKRVIHLAIRWMLDQGVTTALWGAPHPSPLLPEVSGWNIDEPAKAEIDRIQRDTITDPVGPEFMAPAVRSYAAP
jgi:aryl-alcohol dehydrogenase-like predicted oxidoreductase